jgi:hypothetical protein
VPTEVREVRASTIVLMGGLLPSIDTLELADVLVSKAFGHPLRDLLSVLAAFEGRVQGSMSFLTCSH